MHSTAVVEPGARVGAGVKIWHFCHVRSGAILEDGVSLGKDVYIDDGVKVGRSTRVQNGVSLYRGVEVASWCFIGPHVIFTNDLFPRAGLKTWNIVKTTLDTGSSIGAGAIIRCGVRLHKYSMVGAGAIVTKDVLPFHLAVGFPAQAIKMLCLCGQTSLPLGTEIEDVVADCCAKNLEPEAFKTALQEIV